MQSLVNELIVTQWDVNKYNMLWDSLNGWELIVTQWDVNSDDRYPSDSTWEN